MSACGMNTRSAEAASSRAEGWRFEPGLAIWNPLYLAVGRHVGLVAGFLPVLLVMLANSGDSFSVYVSVFADTAERLEVPIVSVVVVCALLAAASARWLVTRSGLARPIQRIARIVLPFLLIAIGTYILIDTTTDAPL